MCIKLLVCLLCIVTGAAPAPLSLRSRLKAKPGPAAKKELTIDWIMRGPGLYGFPPQNVRWSGDSLRVYFQWKKHDEPATKDPSTYVVNRDGSGLRKLTEEETLDAPPLSGDDTRDWKLAVFAKDGDLFIYDRLAGRRHQVTRTLDVESHPRFTDDQKRIAFQRNQNLFVLNPSDGSLEQLTDIRIGQGPPLAPSEPPKKGTDSQERLKQEERSLLEAVRERAEKREKEESRRQKENPRKPLRLATGQSVRDLLLAPGENYVIAMVAEKIEGNKPTLVPDFLNESGYTTDVPSRAKVGDEDERIRMAVIEAKSGETKWVEHGIEQPAPPDSKDKKPVKRDIVFEEPIWSDDGKHIALLGRAADNKDAWIFRLDPQTGKLAPVLQMHDDAWIDGPAFPTLGWLPEKAELYFTWERDGWSHLYTVPIAGGEPKQLTQGKWEVRKAELTPDRSQFLLTTSEVHPGESHLYLMDIGGGARRKITVQQGGHDGTMSPDGTLLATIYSYTNRPPELYLQDLRHEDAKPARVTTSPAPDFAEYAWMDVPVTYIPSRDGEFIPARVYKPKVWKKGGPLVVFVHGAGYLQNVHRRWSYYAREYMFHHLLVEKGYMVLDIDYRASAGYGRNWRTAIYDHMGGKDLNDQVDAVKWAIEEHDVHPQRVGIYGGSYGGFITLMALFTQPDVFRAGASLRPVTDWAHYNHEYTSNILNTPQKDLAAYQRSSPIYHAAGLKGALLICHGMVDTNVHFQDTVRLVQKLIELRKENWEVAVYPAENHGFVQPASWADEYKRILRLFEVNLRAPR